MKEKTFEPEIDEFKKSSEDLAKKQKESLDKTKSELDEVVKESPELKTKAEDIYKDQKKELVEINKKAIDEKTKDLETQIDKSKMSETEKTKAKEKLYKISEESKKALEVAGFESDYLKDLNERYDDLQVEIDDSATVRQITKDKQQRFNPQNISDEFIKQASEGFFDIDALRKNMNVTQDTRLLSRLENKLGYSKEERQNIKDISKDLKSKFTTNEKLKNKAKELFSKEDLSDEELLSKLYRTAIIGSGVIESSMTSEFDINKREEYEPETKKPYARTSQVDQQIGKELLNSYGLKLSGSKENINKEYKRIGKLAREVLQEADLIETAKANVLVPEIVFDPSVQKS
jgi:hypothetical protein